MSLLSYANLGKVIINPNLSLPNISQFNLPNKILQFGTGVLLRGLPDYFVEKANKEGFFNGRIVVVKSTDSGDISNFDKQDNLYTLTIRGIHDQKIIFEDIVCSSISKILHAKHQWQEVLDTAASPDIQIIISNTTEAGLQYVEEKLSSFPSFSFPGKLLQCLYHRYKMIGNTPESKCVVLPTELLTDNGAILKNILLRLIDYNHYPITFSKWLEENITFCNTLVDRIVPGKVSNSSKEKLLSDYGYTDECAIMCEPFALWAIQGGKEIEEVLTFSKVNEEVKIVPDIEVFKELKLRILNATHTLLCAKAISNGFQTVFDAMNDLDFKKFTEELIFQEILPSLSDNIEEELKVSFAKTVIDRFSNPHIEHKWKSIAVQYPMKLTIRVLPLWNSYLKINNSIPLKMENCIKEAILFILKDEELQVDDTSKEILKKIRFHNLDIMERSRLFLRSSEIWGENLNETIKF